MMKPPEFVYRRPKLYPKQRDAIFCPERYALIEATTKSGKTVGSMAWLLEMALQGTSGSNWWWIAPIFAQAKIPYRRMKRGLPGEVYDSNETELTLTLFNGAILWFKGADKPDSLYGEDVYGAVMDEASRCKEEAWHAVRSTLTATKGPIRLIGNVKGRKNFFYQLARKAEAGEPGMHYAKITAPDAVAAGILDAAEIEDARRQLPEAVFRELYLAEPSDDAGNPFGLDAIRACLSEKSEAEPVAWGWDLAKSQDWTVGIGLDGERRVPPLPLAGALAGDDRPHPGADANRAGPGGLNGRGRSGVRRVAGRPEQLRGIQVHRAEQAAAHGGPGRGGAAAGRPGGGRALPRRADPGRDGGLRVHLHPDGRAL
jgi:hypothetical protein